MPKLSFRALNSGYAATFSAEALIAFNGLPCMGKTA